MAIGHGIDQRVQKTQVQRFGEPDAVQRLFMPAEAQQGFRHLDMLAQPVGGRRVERGFDKRKKTIERRHGGQGSGDETGVYQSCRRGRPQAKKNAGVIPFFLAGVRKVQSPSPPFLFAESWGEGKG
ncbi:hypothetical protein Pfra02_28180 [Pseudomonas fragi]|nr:hypothetical protein Pfra02_28180 [Pseudomonas fragi]